MGPIGNPKTSVQNYHSVLHKIPKSEDLIDTAADAWKHTKVCYLFCFLQYLSQGQFTFLVLQPSGKQQAKTKQVGSHDDASYLCSGDPWYGSQVWHQLCWLLHVVFLINPGKEP